MNRERRKLLAKAHELISEARALVEQAGQEERDAYDNLPETVQGGERGERMNEVADALEELASTLEDAETTLEDAQQ